MKTNEEYEKKKAEADKCATIAAKHNRSDPFAYGRAHNLVMNGILSDEDFNDKFCPSV